MNYAASRAAAPIYTRRDGVGALTPNSTIRGSGYEGTFAILSGKNTNALRIRRALVAPLDIKFPFGFSLYDARGGPLKK